MFYVYYCELVVPRIAFSTGSGHVCTADNKRVYADSTPALHCRGGDLRAPFPLQTSLGPALPHLARLTSSAICFL